MLVAALLLGLLAFREIAVFLLRIEGSTNSYGPGAFTGWTVPWNESELLAAAGEGGVWQDNAELAGPFVSWHLTLDLAFAPLLAVALAVVLRRVTTPQARPDLWWRLPVIYLGLDWVETLATMGALHCRLFGGGCSFGVTPWPARAVHLLSDGKWLALLATLFAIVVLYLSSRQSGAWSLHTRKTLDVPWGVVAVVGLTGVVLALPAGGPLDQFPDVVRAQVDQAQLGRPGPVLWSLAALGLLLVTVVLVVPRDGPAPSEPGRTVGSVVVLGVAALLSAVVAVVHWVSEGWWAAWAGLATLAVVVVAWGVPVLVRFVVGSRADDDAPPRASTLEEHASHGRAVLGAAIAFIGAAAVVRAVLPVYMSQGMDPWSDRATLIGSVLAAIVAPAAVYLLVRDTTWRDRLPARARVVIGAALVLAVLGLATALATRPARAAEIGTPATLLVGLAFWTLVVGGLAALGRHVAWPSLRLGAKHRTPWLALFVAIWVVASLLDNRGGYNDARTLRTEAPATRDLAGAFGQWGRQWASMSPDTCEVEGGAPGDAGGRDPRRVPLVLVAAPGGGGKAAYWTALGMDRLFGEEGFCPQSLFAASGVSGGAVGLTAALSLPPRDPERTAAAAVADMTDEGPLAQTVAALLLRDLPQPLTTLRGGWRDRAAVLEDAWASADASGAFDDQSGRNGRKPFVAAGRDWWTDGRRPVILLNGASVNDGCRVLVTNVRLLPVGAEDCLQVPDTNDAAVLGEASGSLDLLRDLRRSRRSDRLDGSPTGLPSTCGIRGVRAGEAPQAYTVRAVTAALLAARFPYVTPSASLRHCLGGSQETTYVVDGGYLENTGMLTLLQLWESLRPRVDACNAATTETPTDMPTGCPVDADDRGLLIEPWFVVLENHYRSVVANPPAGDRPNELLVPLTTNGNRGVTLGTVPLEQLFAAAASRPTGVVDGAGGVRRCNRFVRLAPIKEPTVEAPLGWVLAADTRSSMRRALEVTWNYNVPGPADEPGFLQDRCD